MKIFHHVNISIKKLIPLNFLKHHPFKTLNLKLMGHLEKMNLKPYILRQLIFKKFFTSTFESLKFKKEILPIEIS